MRTEGEGTSNGRLFPTESAAFKAVTISMNFIFMDIFPHKSGKVRTCLQTGSLNVKQRTVASSHATRMPH
jgi:hypothetical protein